MPHLLQEGRHHGLPLMKQAGGNTVVSDRLHQLRGIEPFFQRNGVKSRGLFNADPIGVSENSAYLFWKKRRRLELVRGSKTATRRRPG